VAQNLQTAVPSRSERTPAYQYVLTIILAIVGGFLGILGAVIQEIQSTTTYILLPFLGAPIIEEALKPSGLYLALLWWPRALTSQLFTAMLCALSGLVFGVIEGLIGLRVLLKLMSANPDNPFAAEPFIGHFLWEYCGYFPDRDSAFRAITLRVPFYMGITLLRIARNSWIDETYRYRLIREAKQILAAST